MKRDRPKIEYHESVLQRLTNYSTEGEIPKNSNLLTKCRNWSGYQSKDGYGQIQYKDKTILVHRVSLMVKMNLELLPTVNINGETLEVRHLCNNRICIEPTHLELGTKAENNEDRIENGLGKGEKHHSAKISEELAARIKLSKPAKGTPRKGPNRRKTQFERAVEFDVSESIVRSIDSGYNWSHLAFSDGTTSVDKAKKRNKKSKIDRKRLKETPWTEEQYTEAKEKLSNPNYVKVNETLFSNGAFCKEWIGGHKHGYGQMTIHGSIMKAHIIACTIANGNIRPENLIVRHLCNNTFCVESLHLKFGTPAENIKDKITHGTNAKFPFENVLEIRKLYANGGITQEALAKQFNISRAHVTDIISLKTRVDG